MSQYPCAGKFLQPGEVTSVIEMAVRQKNGFDGGPFQPALAQYFPDLWNFSCESCVVQDPLLPGGVVKEMK